MKCCAECFGDRGLRKNIIPLRSDDGDDGRCDYCQTDGVRLIEPFRLNEYFELLLTAYRRDADGKPITMWLRQDWSLFEHPRMDESRAKDLLSEIFDNGEIVRERFSPANDLNIDPLGDWEKLREELMYHNRFFPKADIDEERLRELLSPLTLEAGKYRIGGIERVSKQVRRDTLFEKWELLQIGWQVMVVPTQLVFLISTLGRNI